MKKCSLFLIVILILILNSCTKDKSLKESEYLYNNDNWQKEILITMGFQEHDIIEKDEYFIIENDFIIYKTAITTDLIEPIPNEIEKGTVTFRQRRRAGLVNTAIVDQIRVRIDPNFNSNWRSLIEEALIRWNSSGSKVFFTVVTTNPHITIYLDTSPSCPSSHRNLASNICGRGTFPSNGNPGNVISINTNVFALNTNPKRLNTITHEFGHNIGFTHADTQDGVHISGTPTSDAASVMNHAVCGQTNLLSQHDMLAARILYPSSPDDEYLVGDWNGNGKSNIAIRRGNKIWMDYNFDHVYNFIQPYGNGNSEDEYLVGDWNGDGKDNIAVRRGNKIWMDYDFDGIHNFIQTYGSGNTEDEYLVGDWNGNGKDNIAVRRGNKIWMDYNFDHLHNFIQTYGKGTN